MASPAQLELASIHHGESYIGQSILARTGAPPRELDGAPVPSGEEPGDDLSGTTTVGERLTMMWPLAVQAWTLSGRSMPDYDRANIPGRLYRRGEDRPQE